MIENIIAKLTAKDDKYACAFADINRHSANMIILLEHIAALPNQSAQEPLCPRSIPCPRRAGCWGCRRSPPAPGRGPPPNPRPRPAAPAYGEALAFHKYVDGQWQDATREDAAWHDIARILQPHSTGTFSISTGALAQPLDEGLYRITSEEMWIGLR